jgi:hypothetical protein
MANINEFLLRDYLGDTGGTDHWQYYSSPDLISHSQIENPGKYFADNYGRDVNEYVNPRSKTNALYVRGKNRGGSALSGRVSVYRASTSLFMTPSLWRNNILKTAPDGDGRQQDYVNFSATANNVAVCDSPLVLDGTKQYFCLVGIASDNNGPVIPEDFATYEAFTKWITSAQGVCVRNLVLLASGPTYDIEMPMHVINPEADSRTVTFVVTLTDAPINTVFSLECGGLDIHQSQTYTGEDKTHILYISTGAPSHFNDLAVARAKTPDGTVAPSNMKLSIEFYYAVNTGSEVYHLGIDVARLGAANPNDSILRALANGNGRLVKLGECAAKIANQ